MWTLCHSSVHLHCIYNAILKCLLSRVSTVLSTALFCCCHIADISGLRFAEQGMLTGGQFNAFATKESRPQSSSSIQNFWLNSQSGSWVQQQKRISPIIRRSQQHPLSIKMTSEDICIWNIYSIWQMVLIQSYLHITLTFLTTAQLRVNGLAAVDGGSVIQAHNRPITFQLVD